MPRDANDLINDLSAALDPSFRNRLLARGQAQSMIRRDGILPDGSPEFSSFLDSDLLNYGYALLANGLDLIEAAADGEDNSGNEPTRRINVAYEAFIQSSYALEAATRNAAAGTEEMFHRLIAGAASHLGGYAARAFSLIKGSRESGQLTPIELTLADLMMRDLNAIEDRARSLRSSPAVSDDAILASLTVDEAETGQLGPVSLLLSENYLSSVSSSLFALEIGDRDLLEDALRGLTLGEQASLDVSDSRAWWVYRLTRRMLGDLFDTSISVNVPIDPLPAGGQEIHYWRHLRRTFIDNLLTRRRSEIDLWPSQLYVVDRIFADTRDLVIALPTSSGKTRIAELAILGCLAQRRRTVYVTPLRALSAQTEQVLTRTFGPLGVRVSAMYGSMGVSDVDGDALRTSEIVVATPEKLDFALRSDPTILDDIGLVVLDEGHMIGASEREVRYEAQIQRLLRRSDASTRRIICLSAVFPSGTELEDFVAWITKDELGGLHKEAWRPTLQRFGLVEWVGDHARMTITLGSDQPFIPRYFEAQQPTGRRKKDFPTDQRELVIATAWRLVGEGQTVLVFCPQRNSVEPYAREIVKLHEQGLITSVLPDAVDLRDALVVGAEWFGAEHPILKCLKLGVAIHHGALPGPFRREIEKLLHGGKLKVTIASPTLAQGLNLSASAVLFHGLRRGRDLLRGSEFANVIGRAGRAFVDTEGLVLYPIFRPTQQLRHDWWTLTNGDGGKALNSGLIAVGITLLQRMVDFYGIEDIESLLNYLTGGPKWTLPVLRGESEEEQATAAAAWRTNLSLLDIGILSVIGDDAYDVDPDVATQVISDALVNSLWERQLNRLDHITATAVRELVRGRVRHLWQMSTPSQRRGWYLAGLGAEAGTSLAEISEQVIELMSQVEVDLALGEFTVASDRLVKIATAIFSLDTFTPGVEVEDWEQVLRHWVQGLRLTDLPGDHVKIAQFIESDLIYRLAWGMEAIRVYQSAQGNTLAEELSGTGVAAIETGTFNSSASILIRAGFDHRLAAVKAVVSTDANFTSTAEMRQWINDLAPWYTHDTTWPSPESRSAWETFASHNRLSSLGQWKNCVVEVKNVTWHGEVPTPNTWLRITQLVRTTAQVWSTGFDLLGEISIRLNPQRRGILRAQLLAGTSGIRLLYNGPDDLFSESSTSL